MKKKLAPLALIAALALAGCSSGSQSADTPLSARASPSASAITETVTVTAKAPAAAKETKSADPNQAWADDMINLLLNGNSKSSFEDFNKDLPHHYIESWGSESEGVLSITVSGDDWKSAELDNLGNTVMFTAGNETPGLLEVNVSSNNGVTGHADRDNLQDF